MDDTPEVIDKPLTPAELGEKYRRMCEDPVFANVPAKLEIDTWGRVIMSPASNYHGRVQAKLSQRLVQLAGQAFVEASVATSAGLFVPDVAWAGPKFMAQHGDETPFTQAPDLCIEVASPSNSLKELNEKVSAYLATGAIEAWIVFPQSQRIEVYGKQGELERSAFAVDVNDLFD
jgi:Uma2 family endonuclease